MTVRRTLRDAIINSFTEGQVRNLVAVLSGNVEGGERIDEDDFDATVAAIVEDA